LYGKVFVDEPESRYQYSTIRRAGFFFKYFVWLTDRENDYDRGQVIQDGKIQEISSFNNLIKNLEIFGPKYNLTITKKIPVYMVEDMFQHLCIGEKYFPLPNDSEIILMYFYPDTWFLTYKNCTI